MLTQPERDELLIRLDERTMRADKALFGNGQPGMLQEVAAHAEMISSLAREVSRVSAVVEDVPLLKDDMQTRKAEAKELREAVPSKRKRALWDSGTLTVIMAAALMAVKTVFGF